MLIHVASFGEDQLSFGATSPPSSAIVSLIFWCISGNLREGSSSSSSSHPSPPDIFSFVFGLGIAASGGRTIPSSRRYVRKAGDRGIIRDLRVDDRYLQALLVCDIFTRS